MHGRLPRTAARPQKRWKGLISHMSSNGLTRQRWLQWNCVLACAVIFTVTLAVFSQVRDHAFINLDDTIYIVENANVATGLSFDNIKWAFTSLDNAAGLYLPISFLSHMVDVHLYGMNPGGHHLTNVFIHALAASLLLLLLYRMTGALWQSSFVAALFALHPLNVESVAWVTERKDVLSALFMFTTLCFYAEFVTNRKKRFYLLALLAFLLGLMSKPMLVTLPILLLLIDFWPLNRFQPDQSQSRVGLYFSRLPSLVKEKIPFFILSLMFGLLTISMQHKVGATQVNVLNPLTLRLENAVTAYTKYLAKLIWPHDLAVYYPYPAHIPLWQVAGTLALLAVISWAAVRFASRYPYLPVGWFWFLLALLPVIGLLQAGSQAMADRFSYLPKIGILILIAWGAPELLKRMKGKKVILALFATAIALSLTLVTWKQLGYWRDSITLFQQTLRVAGGSFIIHDNLGLALMREGRVDDAIEEFRQALQIDPIKAEGHNNLGLALAAKGHLDEAVGEYYKALGLDANIAEVYNNLGIAYARKGDLDHAIGNFARAVEKNPNYAIAHNNLGLALMGKGYVHDAIRSFQTALQIEPAYSDALNNLRFAMEQSRFGH